MDKNKIIELGFCRKPHGIRGAFSLVLENRDETVLTEGMEILLFPLDESSSVSKDGQIAVIEKLQLGNKAILTLKGVADRNQTEEMLPFSISVDRSVFPELDEDTFYVVDMIGLKVIDHNTGQEIGKISGHYENGPQVIYTISGKKHFDLPFVDRFFIKVEVEQGFVEVIVPEYVD